MCRRTKGTEHAYYCREDGHYYLKDDGKAYSQVFVEDNGKAAADADWYGRSWSGQSWEGSSWGKSWSEAAPDQVDPGEDDPVQKADVDQLVEGVTAAALDWPWPPINEHEGPAEEVLQDVEDSPSSDEWPPRTAL